MKKELFPLSEKIKTLREGKQLTQSELAKRMGLTRSAVNAWEMGLSIPSAPYIVELAQTFDVSADYLLGLDSGAAVNISGLNNEQVSALTQLIDCFKKANQA